METLFAVLLVLTGFFLASSLAVYSYGRFARRAQGECSTVLPVSGRQTELDRAVGPLLREHPDQSGLMLLEDNVDAFAARGLTARAAGRSLDLQYYIWEDGLTGRLLVDEILKAADRGVRVRLLLDDINTRGDDIASLGLDAHPSIEVRLFNPSRNRSDRFRRGLEMLLRAFRVTRRMHNKAWVADGRIAIVGGRNIGDAYFGAATTANFRDLDLLMVGPTVPQAEKVFDAYWNSNTAIPITRLARRRASHLPDLRRSLAGLAADDRAKPYLERVDTGPTIGALLAGQQAMHWTGRARIVWDPPEKAEGQKQKNWLIHAIRPLLLSAKDQLSIISPYFIPGDAFTDELVAMVRNRIRVSVLTNSLAATDVAAVHGGYMRSRMPLISAGVRLFELKPYRHQRGISLFGSSSASLHTKAFTVDGQRGFIGSMNFDPRSLSLNTEMGVVFESRALVAAVDWIFAEETSSQKSYRMCAEHGRIVWQDRSGGATRTLHDEPEAGISRRIVATIISFLPIQSQL